MFSAWPPEERPDMAFGGFDRKSGSAPMTEINMVPLIDVMLVLLVIFIITAPLLTHAVKIDLPKATSAPMSPNRTTCNLPLMRKAPFTGMACSSIEKK